MSYVIADERNVAKKKPPFSPTPIFFLTIFFFPIAVPFWIINWGRLGDYRMRMLAAIFGVFGIVLPLIIAVVVIKQGWKAEDLRIVFQLYRGAYALGMLYPQRNVFQRYIDRGGQQAPIWPVIVAALLGLAFTLIRSWNLAN